MQLMEGVRRATAALAAAVVIAAAVAPVAAGAQSGGVPVVRLDGKGWGHGVGLAQWGAERMAEAGADAPAILSTFYPGTELVSGASPEVRVAVYAAPDGRTTFTFPNGGQVLSSPAGEQAPGFPIEVGPGGSVVVSYDGTYRAAPVVTAQGAASPVVVRSTGAGCIPLLGSCPPEGGGDCALGCLPPPTAAPPATPPPTSSDQSPPPSSDATPPASPDPAAPEAPSSGPGAATSTSPLWAAPANGGVTSIDERGRRYRGLLQATAEGGPLRVVNQLDVESYLKGMGEVPSTWLPAAIEAQSVVARTYALRAMTFAGELCDYDLCQVYIGADREAPAQSAAVDATRGEVLTYGGALASTVYSADAGGVTATTEEGFGTPDGVYPYLTTVRYETPDPLPWTVDIALADVASRVGYAGQLTGVSIARSGPSGRALQVELDGSKGPVTVDGRQFASRLGLRSTLFTPTVGEADVAPDAPPPPSAIQALPDDAAAIAAAARQPAPPAEQVLAPTAPRDGAAAALPVRVPRAHDLLRSPATWLALALLGLVTALGLARFGLGDEWVPPPATLRALSPHRDISPRPKLR